jgi:pimeloyl-ACP methyl ester carboxylesterase
MASFILIHGSWHGGWCFDDVKALLEAQGHEVLAPDLPGMGGDAEALKAATLDAWADFAVSLCRRATQRPVILCGHSRGGIVISQAAEEAPQAMDALVYICAMMLPDGLSRAAFKAMQQPNTAFDSLTTPVLDGLGTRVDSSRAAAVFAQLSPPDKVANHAAAPDDRTLWPRAAPLYRMSAGPDHLHRRSALDAGAADLRQRHCAGHRSQSFSFLPAAAGRCSAGDQSPKKLSSSSTPLGSCTNICRKPIAATTLS